VQEELKKAKRQLKGEEAKDREAEKRFHDALAAIEAELTNERAAVDKLEQKEDELRRAKTNYEAFVRMEAEQEEQVRHATTQHAHDTHTTRHTTILVDLPFFLTRVCAKTTTVVFCARADVGVQRGHHSTHRASALSAAVRATHTHARTAHKPSRNLI
jgi:myosin heavy subunit